jgi:RHS repeat-associated protein
MESTRQEKPSSVIGFFGLDVETYDPQYQYYDLELGRWFTPDPAEQFHNPYLAMGNNPVMYVDPDGEFVWMIPVIAGVVFGGVNLGIQASNGDINNFGDGLKAFGSGFVAGATIATGVLLGLGVPILGPALKIAGLAYAAPTALGTVVNTIHGVSSGDWSRLGNTWEQFGGNFYLDENRNFFAQTWQGISRFSWELPQSTIGHGFSQVRNMAGGVDRVDYFGGVTFSTGENNENGWGVSIGNHINISLRDEIEGDFRERLLRDPLYMHEYGHTFQSQVWGPLYLPAIGAPSFYSASTSSPNDHSRRWYEMQANSYAGWYFKRLGVDWDDYKDGDPRLMDR